MDPATMAVIGQIANAITQVGIPAVKQIIALFESSEDPSWDEINAIGNTMVHPDRFFDEK